MNKEEAIEILLMLSSLNNSETHPKCNEALTMAIEALEQKPPVISDEEIQNENYRRFDLIGMNGTFNDGAVWMRKLLTNKEY